MLEIQSMMDSLLTKLRCAEYIYYSLSTGKDQESVASIGMSDNAAPDE